MLLRCMVKECKESKHSGYTWKKIVQLKYILLRHFQALQVNCEIEIKPQIAYLSKTHDVSVTEKDLWLDFGYRHVFVLPSHWQKLTEDQQEFLHKNVNETQSHKVRFASKIINITEFLSSSLLFLGWRQRWHPNCLVKFSWFVPYV